MEVDQGTPLPPGSGHHGSWPGYSPPPEVVIMEVDQGTPPSPPPLDRPHICHLPSAIHQLASRRFSFEKKDFYLFIISIIKSTLVLASPRDVLNWPIIKSSWSAPSWLRRDIWCGAYFAKRLSLFLFLIKDQVIEEYEEFCAWLLEEIIFTYFTCNW